MRRISDREHNILDKYEATERVLTKDFIESIPWNDVSKYELGEEFLPVLLYMRDIEAYTDVYYQELLKTPTGEDPVIRRFMDKWAHEEQLHAELINRFLEEAGMPSEDKWYENITRSENENALNSKLQVIISRLIGKRFTAVHMTWGAIQELSTLQGYKRLWERAQHPVLEKLLRGIAAEEASHIFFYRSIAEVKLQESKVAQKLARFLIKTFWRPIGAGVKPDADVAYVIRTLFGNEKGLDSIERHVNGSLAQLPGFSGSHIVTDGIQKQISMV